MKVFPTGSGVVHHLIASKWHHRALRRPYELAQSSIKKTRQRDGISGVCAAAARSALAFSAVLMLAVVTTQLAQAQTPTTLYSFCSQTGCPEGYNPAAGLVQATNGQLYGVTESGGAHDGGVLFSITPSGTPAVVYSFCSLTNCADGQLPAQTLIQATNGDLYGTTFCGGTGAVYGCNAGAGTVFDIPLGGGTLTTLYSFCSLTDCADGASPTAALTQANNGDLYGVTRYGAGYGSIFDIAPGGGTLTTLVGLDSTDGNEPNAGLVQASNGYLYGTVSLGGANDNGTLYRMTPSGQLVTVYNFCSLSNCADGNFPEAMLIQASNGDLYGTTYYGGANNGAGTVFKITPSGALTTVYSFCSLTDCADGYNPTAGLIQATDGNFYGTTYSGGAHSGGTIFKLTPGGTLTTLYSFCSQTSCADGLNPNAGLIQATNGVFYGTTENGGIGSSNGAGGDGIVFSLSVGLTQFVKTLPTSGAEGSTVDILGTDLTGATSVSFHGTAAAFSVVSPSEITATVPASATTGLVSVTTPGGTLASNLPFVVTVPTSTSVTSSANPSAYDQSVTLTATVSSTSGAPTGTVTFKNGSAMMSTVTLSGGVATFVTSKLALGTAAISAVYNGNGQFTSSTSSVLSQGVDAASTKVNLTSSLNPAAFGQSLTFTATVVPEFGGTPAGKVTFKNGSAVMNTVTLSGGVATFTTSKLALGTDSITAVYNGNADFSGSTSPVLSQVVNAAPTSVSLTSSTNPSTSGQSVTFTATVVPEYSGTPAGRVTFKNGSATLGPVTLSGGVATFATSNLPVGTDSITAVYSGNADFSGSTSPVLSQTVNAASP
jgi:uncharacterized repeat protein (TIGR03803 family)